MTRRFGLLLFLANLGIVLLVAAFQHGPGYMDADYYYAGGKLVALGSGSGEPYLWNYLNDPAGLPAPRFSYWMPLTALIAAAGLKLLPAGGFWSARLVFLLLAGGIAPLTAVLALRLTGSLRHARLAGVLALFPGFYLAFLPTTDSFALWMVLGALFFLTVLAGQRSGIKPLHALALGGLAGLLHLSRADGLLWVLAAMFAILLLAHRAPARVTLLVGLAAAAYLLVMTPWLVRNQAVWGRLLPPGSAHALWITDYAETMLYPPAQLTPERWLAAGFRLHFAARWQALLTNLQSMLAVQGGIVLLPCMVWGLWLLRRGAAVRVGAAVWLLLLAVMTVVFPYAGPNGSFYHSGAALQPLLWAAAPIGIERLGLAYAGWRQMEPQRFVRFLSLLFVITAALLSAVLTVQRVSGQGNPLGPWNRQYGHYQAVQESLDAQAARQTDTVLVGNPPAYWLVSGHPAIMVPAGGLDALQGVAERFNARWLVLEYHHPQELDALYEGSLHVPWLVPLQPLGSTRLFRVALEGEQE